MPTNLNFGSVCSQNLARYIIYFMQARQMNIIILYLFAMLPGNFLQYCKEYALHPSLGFLTHPDHQITSFDFRTLLEMAQLMADSQIEHGMTHFPDIRVTRYAIPEDNVILHDLLVVFLNKFLSIHRKRGLPDKQAVLHPNLCVPLQIVSIMMDIKPAMVINICYNWVPLNNNYFKDPLNFSFADFDLRWHLTDDHTNEKYFFGASIVGAFHLGRTMQAIFEIQRIIEESPEEVEEVRVRLEVCLKALEKINAEVRIMLDSLNAEYFWKVLRPMVSGHEGLLFRGIRDVSGPIEEDLRHGKISGGTGGYDPSFQLLESALGIKFKLQYKATQDTLFNEGMCWQHKEAINSWRRCNDESKLNIRERCKKQASLKEAYNKLLKSYKSFLGIHSSLIAKFIMSNIKGEKDKADARGTGNTLISDIMKRFSVIDDQLLP